MIGGGTLPVVTFQTSLPITFRWLLLRRGVAVWSPEIAYTRRGTRRGKTAGEVA